MGQPIQALVVEENEQGIVLDFNHPLAGKDLNFSIELVGIE
jgi:FKBP-type peptidyl-prolyl cis-trans isomerase 2